MNTTTNVTPLAWLVAGCVALGACQQATDTSSSTQSLESSERSAASPSASDDDGAPPPPPPRHRHGPPPEAISACADLVADAECSVTLPGPDGEHTISGTCRSLPAPPGATDATGVVACVPTDMPSRPHRGPPPEAFSACADLAAEADCSVTLGDHTIEGTCRTARDSDALLCVPAHPPSPPPPPADEEQ